MLQSLAIVLFCAALPPVSAFLLTQRLPETRYQNVIPSLIPLSMNKMRGYYTISEENGNGWSLFQDGIEGAVFLGNRLCLKKCAKLYYQSKYISV